MSYQLVNKIPEHVYQIVFRDGKPSVKQIRSDRVWRNQYHPMREHLFSVAPRLLPKYMSAARSSRPAWVQRKAQEMNDGRR